MTTLRGKSALVIGGSSGVGKSTVSALMAEGARVTVVARNEERLAQLQSETTSGQSTIAAVQGDASDVAFLERLLRDVKPDVIAHVGGNRVSSALFTEYDWDTFSEAWNNDMKTTFHLLKLAHTLPLAPGAQIVIVSSGASINGSPISGGYAGAKRMQWLLGNYAQKYSDQAKLGIRTTTVVPRQLIEGTAIAARASEVYGAMEGLTAQQFMNRFPKPLTTHMVASAIVQILRGDGPAGVGAIGVTGDGIETLN